MTGRVFGFSIAGRGRAYPGNDPKVIGAEYHCEFSELVPQYCLLDRNLRKLVVTLGLEVIQEGNDKRDEERRSKIVLSTHVATEHLT